MNLDFVEHKNFGWFLNFLVFLFPPLIFFFRPGFLGYDSYYFLTEICHGNPIYQMGQNILSDVVFSGMPCSEFHIKIHMLIIYMASMFMIYACVHVFYPKEAKYAGLFALVIPAFMYSFFKLENDFLAYPFMFGSVFFFLKSIKEKYIYFMIPSILFLGIAFLFWQAVVYYLLIYSVYFPILLLAIIAVLIIKPEEFITNLIPRLDVAENNPLKTLVNLIYITAIFYCTNAFNKIRLNFFLFISLVVSFLNPKLLILFIPFFALSITEIYSNLNNPEKKIFLILSAIFVLSWGLSLLNPLMSPSPIDFQASEEVIAFSTELNKPIANDFQFGHLIYWFGGTTSFHSGPTKRKLEDQQGHVILTVKELDCPILKEHPGFLFNHSTKIYNC